MDVFVYGTLTDPHRALAVVPDAVYLDAATLDGLRRVEGRYPTLAPGGSTEGRLLRTDDVAALDRYEGVEGQEERDDGLYARISVPTDDGREVAVYVGDAERLATDESVEWPGEGPLDERVRRYVEDEDVIVRVAEAP